MKQLRKDIYCKKRQSVMTKYGNSKKTGGGGVTWLPWEDIVIRMKRDNDQLDGLDVANSDEALTKTQNSAFSDEIETIEIRATCKKPIKREMKTKKFLTPGAYTPHSSRSTTPFQKKIKVGFIACSTAFFISYQTLKIRTIEEGNFIQGYMYLRKMP